MTKRFNERSGFTLADILVLLCIVGMLTAFAIPAFSGGASGYASDQTITASSAAVTLPPVPQEQWITSLFGETDKKGGTIKVYTRSGDARQVTSAPTNGAVAIELDNVGPQFTNSDVVVYAHDDGTLDQTTISSVTATNVTLTAGVSQAGAVGDFLYEVAQRLDLEAGASTAAVGTNTYRDRENEFLLHVPRNSPVYVVLDGTSNAVVNVTSRYGED